MFVSGPCKIGKTTFCAKVHSLFEEQLRALATALGPVHFKGFLSVEQRRDSERMGLEVAVHPFVFAEAHEDAAELLELMML